MSDIVVGEDGLTRPSWAAGSPLLREYYDNEWGLPVRDERGLFERLTLEGFQAGLSWKTILQRRPAFRVAFVDFDPEIVAAFTDEDRMRLLNDPKIIRNQAKINAAINNAGLIVQMRDEGGLAPFIWSFQPLDTPCPQNQAEVPTSSPESVAMAQALKSKGFKFVGPTITFALMQAIGMVDTHLLGTHRRGTSGIWTD